MSPAQIKTKTHPKIVSLRVSAATFKDIAQLGKSYGTKTQSDTLRLLLHTGFSNLGNWRKK